MREILIEYGDDLHIGVCIYLCNFIYAYII